MCCETCAEPARLTAEQERHRGVHAEQHEEGAGNERELRGGPPQARPHAAHGASRLPADLVSARLIPKGRDTLCASCWNAALVPISFAPRRLSHPQTAVTRTVNAPSDLRHGRVPDSARFVSGCRRAYRVFGHHERNLAHELLIAPRRCSSSCRWRRRRTHATSCRRCSTGWAGTGRTWRTCCSPPPR